MYSLLVKCIGNFLYKIPQLHHKQLPHLHASQCVYQATCCISVKEALALQRQHWCIHIGIPQHLARTL